jgi:lysophospholipase L1-like esterase
MVINQNSRILFTGDSITDCGRDRNDFHSLSGYNKIINDYIQLFYPELNVSVFNRGISGDTTKMLLAKIEKDINDTKPDIVSVLIGINDVWRRYDSNIATSVEEFAENYIKILTVIKKHTSNIIILEPFLIPSDEKKNIFREDLDPKINKLREISRLFKTEYIPLDGIFWELSIEDNPLIYSADGVHPLYKGNCVIAQQWLKKTNLGMA